MTPPETPTPEPTHRILSEDRAAALAEALQDGLLVRDLDGHIVETNGRFCEMVGLPAEALEGRAPPLPHWTEDGDPLRSVFLDPEGGHREVETTFRRADGEVINVVVSVAPLRDAEGALTAYLETVKDVTARFRSEAAARASAERHRAIVETAVSAVVVIDEDGVIDSVNPAVEGMFGYPPHELTGRPVSMLMPEPDRSLHDGYVRRYLGGGEPQIIGVGRRVLGRRRDGSGIWVHLSVGEMHVGGRRMFTGVMHDVDDLVRAEDELRAERDRAERLATEQAALTAIAESIVAESPPATVLGLVAEGISTALGASMASVVRFDADDHVIAAAHGLGHFERAGASSPRAAGSPIDRVRETGMPVRLDGVGSLPPGHPTRRMLDRTGITSLVAVPVRVGSHLWGAVWVAERVPLAWDAEGRLAAFANLVTAAISQSDARSTLMEQAATDPLTGLANHRVFHERLAAEFERATRHGRDLALAILDLDMLKQINDTFGHQTGDQVIAEVGRRLAAVARPGDLVGRIGGDEFGWILPETDGLGAHQDAERARRLLAASPMGNVGSLSASAGVADISRATSADELFHLADGALYWAKAHGRDATFLYSPEVVQELSADARAQRLAQGQAMAGLRALARAIDAKDPSTQRHSERVADIAGLLVRVRGWDRTRRARLHEAALLHDVGKIGVPDAILFKEGLLTPDEYEVVKQHAALGARIASEVLDEEQVMWLRGHHERFDGSGYPDGLAGLAISEGARVLVLADAWDVMTSERTYKKALSTSAALVEINAMAGRQFDPELVSQLERALAGEPEIAAASPPVR